MSTTTSDPPHPAPSSAVRLVVAADWEQVVASSMQVLSGPTDDPFSLPLLVTPSRAHALALAQRVALHEGVAVGLSGVSARRLRADLEARLLGLREQEDPWRVDALALRIADIIEGDGGGWLAAVQDHLARLRARGVPSPGWDLARRTAGSLLRTAAWWPEHPTVWAGGAETLADGSPLDPAHRWWAPLWQRLVHQETSHPDPLRRHRMLLDALRSAALPWRQCLWLSCASTSPVDRGLAAALGGATATTVIHLDHTAPGPTDARHRWAAFDRVRPAATRSWTRALAVRPERPTAPDADSPATDLLSRLRGGVAGGINAPDAASDGSVVIHDCHGPDRQAEVIRDVLCDALADMSDLEPRDLLVVCPAGSTLPRLLSGLTSPPDPGSSQTQHPGRRIRVAPSAVERPNPVAMAVLTVLRLRSARATATELIDLCALPVVSRRFRFSADDLATIARLVEDAGVRWGVDAGSRAAAGLPEVRQSTWMAGIERMLLGAAMAATPPGWIATVTPVEGIGSADVDLVGRLAELVSRVRRALLECGEPTTLDRWAQRVARIVEEITDSADQPWAGPATVGALSSLAGACPRTVMDSGRIADILESRTVDHGRPAWFSGAVQICTPDDLDGIDHSVVVLADPDSTVSPAEELPGLRRSEDPERDSAALGRQLLVDALASARRRLVVVRQSLDPVTNAAVLPGPFSTTLEAALQEAGVRGSSVTVAHGLQPFSAAESTGDRGGNGPRWRSFDPAVTVGPTAGPGPRPAPEPLPAPADLPSGSYSPADLVTVLNHPARALLRTRLGTDTRTWRREPDEELPVDVGPLEGYGVRSRLLADLDSGATQTEALTAERLRGSTPPGRLGLAPLRAQADRAAAILADADRARGGASPEFVGVDLELNGGALPPLTLPPGALTDPDRPLRLEGRVRVWGRAVVRTSASRASARDLLALWIDLLAVAAGSPGPWRAVLASNSPARVLTAPGAERATELLAGLARLAWWSAQQFIPLPPRTAAVLTGLVPGPPSDWASGRSGVGVQWARDHDSDWGAFIGDSEENWRSACTAAGTSAEELSGWLFGPLMAATSGGAR